MILEASENKLSNKFNLDSLINHKHINKEIIHVNLSQSKLKVVILNYGTSKLVSWQLNIYCDNNKTVKTSLLRKLISKYVIQNKLCYEWIIFKLEKKQTS